MDNFPASDGYFDYRLGKLNHIEGNETNQVDSCQTRLSLIRELNSEVGLGGEKLKSLTMVPWKPRGCLG